MIFVAIRDGIMYFPSHYPSHESEINLQNRSLIHLNSWRSTVISTKFGWDYAVIFMSQRRPLNIKKIGKKIREVFLYIKMNNLEGGAILFLIWYGSVKRANRTHKKHAAQIQKKVGAEILDTKKERW